MKYFSCLSIAICFLAAGGCPSGGPPSAVARLEVSSASARLLTPSSTTSQRRADDDIAVAKVVAHAQSPEFRAAVANSLGISQDVVGNVTLQGVVDTRLVDVRVSLADRELAARVVNEAAKKLAEDFRNSPDVTVRVIGYANLPRPMQERK